MIRQSIRWAVAIAALAAVAIPLLAEEPTDEEAAYVRSHYTKFEVRISMRDGARLFTAVYLPNDAAEGRRYPMLMTRTPYSVSPYGANRYKRRLGASQAYAEEGFVFVYQDVRGRNMSEGDYINMRPHREGKSGTEVDESSDTWDTVEWLVHHVPHNNGKLGIWGISYPGFYTAAGIVDSHPAIAAASPQAPIADWFWDDMHHNGAFILPLAFRFFSTFGVPREGLTTERPDDFEYGTPDGFQFYLDLGPLGNANERHFEGKIPFWNDLAAHPNYDEFWQSRNLLPHLRNIRCPVMVVGGWFDTEDLYGPLEIYRTIQRQNPKTWSTLVMGPWSHGGWSRTPGDELGGARFGFATSLDYQARVELPFFRRFLKGEGELDLPEALVFETGADRWRSFDAWPPEGIVARRFHLRAGGGLTAEAPVEGEAEAAVFVSDPAKPVPYTHEITTRWAKTYMTEDQRWIGRRPDVLVFQSEPLEDDLTLAGPLSAELVVSTDRGDADWIVKLIDVWPGEVPGWQEEEEGDYPGGRQQLVRWEVMRGRFRNSVEHPEPFVAGQPTPVSFALRDAFHTFKRGHRLMVQVQSSWFPFVDRNPQRWVDNIFEAQESDFVPATHRVFHSAEHSSALVVGVLQEATGVTGKATPY